jgi:hypothetical protein
MRLSLLITCILVTFIHRAESALVDISNLNDASNGAFNLFTENGGNLSDPPATIFIGTFASYTDSNKANISSAFTNNFSALAADFTSIGSVGVEEDGLFNQTGIHDSSNAGLTVAPADYNRNLAIWITTSGTINDQNAEHLIYFTNEIFTADAPIGPENTYQVELRNGSGVDAGNGFLAVGGNTSYSFDHGAGGVLVGFNTVAIPEPSSIFILLSLSAIGWGVYRFRRRTARPRVG